MNNHGDHTLFKGVQSRWQDLLRTMEISRELLRGFKLLADIGPCVTVFGSSRFPDHHHYYQLAQKVGQALGRAGYNVMTGGGPGIMEAANRGAQEVGALSVGCNSKLPCEQQHNPFLDLHTEFNHFFVRKVMLVKFSCAFVVLPGGFGTMDEIFETLNLIETQKIENFPLVIMGADYWRKMEDFVTTDMLDEGTIDQAAADRMYLTDDPQSMVNYIRSQIPTKLLTHSRG